MIPREMTGEVVSADGSEEVGGHIELHRDSDPRADDLVPYRIFVDGEPRGQIRPGERHQLTVRPGQHRVSLTCYRFWRSPLRDVEVASGQTVRMRCRPSSGLQYSRLFDLAEYIRLVEDLDQDETSTGESSAPFGD
jgi:hypothetical protein